MARGQVLAIVLLGIWLGLTFGTWYAAAGSFSTTRRVLEGRQRDVAEAMELLGAEWSRLVLRHLTSEINRTYFRAYGWAQAALGVLLLAALAAARPRDVTALVVVGAMFVVALVLTFYLTPQITELGRQIDFVPRDPPPPEYARFRMLHGAFTALDGAKTLAGLGLVVRWMVMK
jgi:hypothetical protein